MSALLVIGLMSGTSMDGVDAALLETDGEGKVNPLGFVTLEYSDEDRKVLRNAMHRALSMESPASHPDIIAASHLVDRRHLQAITRLIETTGVESAVDLIGYHGQTIAHRPDRGWTWQIGSGQAVADACGIPVVDDFRSADVAEGGQGAPLVPAYHRARLNGAAPAIVLNLGGVGNITAIGGDGDLLAFDTGPANALIDDWMLREAGLPHDPGGSIAAQGEVAEAVLASLLDNDWFAAPPPKSLDRNDFSISPVTGLGVADGAATLTAFTAATVALGLRHCPEPPREIHVAGGGRHNTTLMEMIKNRTGLAALPVETLGWNGDATEAEAFGYLAVRLLKGLPTSYPATTGVRRPIVGGRLNRPAAQATGSAPRR